MSSDKLAVVVPTNNYNDFLPEALESLKRQILQPDEVIVVDDNSIEPCYNIAEAFGYRYLRVEHNNPLKAREAGYNATNSNYLCFLDADDILPPEYLLNALATLSNGIDITYSDIQRFGNTNKLITFNKDLKPQRLWQVNFLHVGCVVSREAILLSNAFWSPASPMVHEDWLFWRNIIRMGFKFKKHSCPYWQRMHDRNRSTIINQGEYFETRGIKYAPIDKRWHRYRYGTIDWLRGLNICGLKSIADYVGYGYSDQPKDQNQKLWLDMAQYFDHDVAAVYDEKNNIILFVGPILRHIILRSPEMDKWDLEEHEKIVII